MAANRRLEAYIRFLETPPMHSLPRETHPEERGRSIPAYHRRAVRHHRKGDQNKTNLGKATSSSYAWSLGISNDFALLGTIDVRLEFG